MSYLSDISCSQNTTDLSHVSASQVKSIPQKNNMYTTDSMFRGLFLLCKGLCNFYLWWGSFVNNYESGRVLRPKLESLIKKR